MDEALLHTWAEKVMDEALLHTWAEKVMDEALLHTWSWLRCMEKGFQTHFNHWSTNLEEELS
ncbi:hypothetical protein GYH30_015543 [Glycine max]|nr:hypothetical protein GYH30_015543 [Glycine max]